MSNIIAIIPARGGSKRIPGKNIVDFMGKPMIAWTIEAALSVSAVSRVVVSTDAEEIAAVARAYGAEVPFLREACADDHSPVSAATALCLQMAARHYYEEYDTVIQLMPNCPLRGAGHIQTALDHFSGSGAVSQLSCVGFGWTNPWWAFSLDGDSKPTPVFPEALVSRSQDLPTLYAPTGAIWIARAAEFIQSRNFYMNGHTFYPIDWIAGADIDEPSDLATAKALFPLSNLAEGAQT